MSIQTTATITNELIWSNIDSQDYVNISDIGTIGDSYQYTSGTGVTQINTIWHNTSSLANGLEDIYDLTNLTQTLFGNTSTVDFTDGVVKGISISNESSGTIGTDFIVFGPSGAENPFSSPFGGKDDANIPIYPSGSFGFINRINGYPVTVSEKNIRVANSGASTAHYDIAIIGVT
jgi:hypothetical protein